MRANASLRLETLSILVTPVTLSCYPSTLTKAERWYQIPERRFHLTLHVGDDIALDDFSGIRPQSVGVRRFTRYLQDYFTQQRELYKHDGK